MKKSKVLMLCLVAAAVVATVLLTGVFMCGNLGKRFIANTTDAQYREMLMNIDLLMTRAPDNIRDNGFRSVDELGTAALFNLYASTEQVQEKLRAAADDSGAVIELTDFRKYLSAYFGEYSFTAEQLLMQVGGRLTPIDDGSVLLSPINGGVSWPDGPNSEITISSITTDGKLVTVSAKHHCFDNESIGLWYDEVLTVKPTKGGGFRYVSYWRT